MKSNDAAVNVFLSHDIDYSKKGPPTEHILNRRTRFDGTEFARYQEGKTSLYYNIPDLMEIEEKLGIRSTFFFRPFYETGDLESYEDDIQDLLKGNWEIGLHANDVTNIAHEKETLEAITKQKIDGCRVHFLRTNSTMYSDMKEIGFKYDSSVCHSRDKLDPKNARIENHDGILVFPITIMDAYLFTYMKITEENLLSTVDEAMKMTRESGNLLTLLWHDTSIKMKGGRKYKEIMEHILSERNVNIVTGTEAYAMFTSRRG